MSGPAPQWMPREQWEALVRGEGCVLCAALTANAPVTAYAYTVADLAVSRLWLATNQAVRGYCVLVARRHVREPYELADAEQAAYFRDLMRVGQTLERAFGAIKMNFELLGNAVPHLHCHVKPRYYGGPAPGRPIHPDDQPLRLTAAEYEQRVAAIRVELDA
jgi:diadenosine tetraphosphate (Ap4A) HIT family hydrolase